MKLILPFTFLFAHAPQLAAKPARMPAYSNPRLSGAKRCVTRFHQLFAIVALSLTSIVALAADEVENPPEVAGFWGQMTGEVKSTTPDAPNFVLSISKADFDPSSVLKDIAPLIGKQLTIGVRMPKDPAGVAHPHPDDTAYVKTLKPGMVITVKIFAPRANPRLLRIQAPGKTVE